MPRAALRRPDPAWDLSPWLLEAADLPPVLTGESLFGCDRPLVIEVGSGKGLFLRGAAERCPEHSYLGIEIAKKYAVHAAARLRRGELTNAKMFAGDATPIFRSHGVDDDPASPPRLPDGSVEAVHVYFPDPWWKKRHRKRRVLSETNIRNFSRVLRTGGQLHFWTDVLDYFELTVELIAEIAPEFGVPLPETERESQHDLDFQTHFERRSRKLGIPVYRVKYRKRTIG